MGEDPSIEITGMLTKTRAWLAASSEVSPEVLVTVAVIGVPAAGVTLRKTSKVPSPATVPDPR